MRSQAVKSRQFARRHQNSDAVVASVRNRAREFRLRADVHACASVRRAKAASAFRAATWPTTPFVDCRPRATRPALAAMSSLRGIVRPPCSTIRRSRRTLRNPNVCMRSSRASETFSRTLRPASRPSRLRILRAGTPIRAASRQSSFSDEILSLQNAADRETKGRRRRRTASPKVPCGRRQQPRDADDLARVENETDVGQRIDSRPRAMRLT